MGATSPSAHPVPGRAYRHGSAAEDGGQTEFAVRAIFVHRQQCQLICNSRHCFNLVDIGGRALSAASLPAEFRAWFRLCPGPSSARSWGACLGLQPPRQADISGACWLRTGLFRRTRPWATACHRFNIMGSASGGGASRCRMGGSTRSRWVKSSSMRRRCRPTVRCLGTAHCCRSGRLGPCSCRSRRCRCRIVGCRSSVARWSGRAI